MRIQVANAFGWCVRASTLVGLIVHFAVTLLFVSPMNPLKMEYRFWANVTIGTFFPQNWSVAIRARLKTRPPERTATHIEER